MLRTTLARAARVHKPLIQFPDRSKPPTAHEPGPHPEAPAEVAENFSQFRETLNSGPHFHPEKAGSSSGGAGGAPAGVADDIRELPPRFWDTLSLRFDEAEMEAIMSGGATNVS